jgi:hypothetical protein
MEMYYDDNTDTGYPGDGDETGCNDWSVMDTALTPKYMGAMPEDPGTYSYAAEVDIDKQDYVLRAQMENDVPDGDVDDTTYGCACDDATKYYCIKP